MYTIGQFSIMTKIPKKTLRYYDEIDLLNPVKIDYKNNYRYYDDSSLLIAQQILIYRNCDMPLEKIREIISQPHNKKDLKQILESQFEFLQQKMSELRQSQDLLENIIKSLEERREELVKDTIHEEKTVLSIRRIGNHSTIGEIIGELFETAVHHGLNVIGPHTIIWHTDMDFTEDAVDMEIYIPVGIKADCDLQNIRKTDKQKYCEIVHQGSMATLSSSYARIYAYVEKNGLTITGPFEETFKSDGNFVNPANLQITVAVPVSEKLK